MGKTWSSRVCVTPPPPKPMGRFVVQKNNMWVTSPESIRGIYDCAFGNFGVPQYDGSMTDAVVYPKANQKPCKNFDISFKSRVAGLPTFVLVNREGLTFISLFLNEYSLYLFIYFIWFTGMSCCTRNLNFSLLIRHRLLLLLVGLERTTNLCRTILVVDNRPEPLITISCRWLPAKHHESFSSGQEISRERHQNINSSRWTRSYKSGLAGGSSTPELPSSLQAKDQEQWWVRIQIWCTDPVSQEVQRSCSDSWKRGYTRFTPHYITWYCSWSFSSRQTMQIAIH